MRGKMFSIGLRALAVFAVTLLATSTWAATNWKETVLYSFCSQPNCADGRNPSTGLIFDAAGNLYGTTTNGGTYNYGTVFELTPNGSGGWTKTVLYSFCSQPNCTDGVSPSASLIFDAAGNLYGATYWGGAYYTSCGFGCGTVFELRPTAGGGWTEQVLHNFGNGTDGANPDAALIFDAAGNLYGTTGSGGSYGGGTAFELTPIGGDNWAETGLYSICSLGGPCQVYRPVGGLIFDTFGNLYGMTNGGGAYGNYGTVFELIPTAGGGWTGMVLHSFGNGTDGYYPQAGLIFDTAGNLYGMTEGGGTYGDGMAFELTPMSGSNWAETVLYSFCAQTNCTDGALPYAGLIFDAAGNLYSTTANGGTYGYGTTFELTSTAGGGWTERVLHSFNNNGTDGVGPSAGLIFDAAGNLYGTTYDGGTYNYGTVFELTPVYPCVVCSHAVRR